MIDQKREQQLQKRFGNALSRGNSIPALERQLTGIAGLDYITCGGLPIGRICMIYGPNGVGKSTLCMELLKVFQQRGQVAYIDAERTVEANDFIRLGLNPDDILVMRPDHAEDAIEFLIELADIEGKFVVVDSVPAMIPKSKEERLEENVAANDVGTQARFFSGVQPLLIRAASKGMTVCFINQIRSNFNTYGPKTSLPGGQALPYLCSLMLDLTSNKKVTDAESNTICTRVTCTKNKGGYKDLCTELDLTATGIDRIASILTTGKESGVLETKGAWVYVKEDIAKQVGIDARIGQGMAAAYKQLEANSNLYQAVYMAIISAIPKAKRME